MMHGERQTVYEPSHEIMAFSVLCKLILQTCMRSHPVGLDVWFLVGPFAYFHTSCVRTAKALAILPACAGSPEPSLVAYVISTIISCTGSYKPCFWHSLIWVCTVCWGLPPHYMLLLFQNLNMFLLSEEVSALYTDLSVPILWKWWLKFQLQELWIKGKLSTL